MTTDERLNRVIHLGEITQEGKTCEVEIIKERGRSAFVRTTKGHPFRIDGMCRKYVSNECWVSLDRVRNIHFEELPYIDEDQAAVDAEAAIRETQEWLDQAEIDTRRYYGEA